MFSKALRVFRTVHRYVVGGESWSSAWEAIKGEIGNDLPTLAGYGSAGLAMIGTLAGDVSWAGIVVLTFCAFVAGRQFVIQQQAGHQPNGPLVDNGRPSAPALASASPPEPRPKIETAEERQAKHELTIFSIECIIPACDEQRNLQSAIIERLCDGMQVMEQLAITGLEHSGPMPVFLATYGKLKWATKNHKDISFRELMELVLKVSKGYTGFCSLSSWLCRDTRIDHRKDELLSVIYQNWKEKSNQLESDYEQIRRDPRFTDLYDPSPKQLGMAFTAEP